MEYTIQEYENIRYYEIGNKDGEVILLLHGLFGSLRNFHGLVEHFKPNYKIVLPILPIYELSPREISLDAYVAYVERLINHKGYTGMHVLGNSLGGHIALLLALKIPEVMTSMILTGSSGLFEDTLGGKYPRRGNYEFIDKKARSTFYDPTTPAKDEIDEVYNVINDRKKVLNIIATAKSALRYNMIDKLEQIKTPTLLVWGQQDIITPPFVAEKFRDGISNAKLVFVDKCGHVPMMEHPTRFNHILEPFLQKLTVNA